MQNSVQEKSIKNLFNKYFFDPDHANQVKKLSLLIFDKTKGFLHNFSDHERILLEAGSFLHDIGYCVSSEGHNKHSYALITESSIEGFSTEETEIIANIARYHRGKKPRKTHPCFGKLADNKDRELVKKLSSMVRMADGLDRSHLSVIESLDCTYDSYSQILYVIMRLNIPDCGFEIWAADRKKELFEEEFGVRVIFKVK